MIKNTLKSLIKACGTTLSSVAFNLGCNSTQRVYYLNYNPHKITICERNKLAQILNVDILVIEALIDCDCVTKRIKKTNNKQLNKTK